MENIIVVVNPKGGSGNTTIATQIIPALIPLDKDIIVNVYSISDYNHNDLSNSKQVNYRQCKLSDVDDAINEASFHTTIQRSQSEKKTYTIIDIGSKGVADIVFKSMEDMLYPADITYIIPILREDLFHDFQVDETIKKIQRLDPKSKIFVAINQCDLPEEKHNYGFDIDDNRITSRFEKIEKDIEDIIVIPKFSSMNFISGIEKKTIRDVMIENQNINMPRLTREARDYLKVQEYGESISHLSVVLDDKNCAERADSYSGNIEKLNEGLDIY